MRCPERRRLPEGLLEKLKRTQELLAKKAVIEDCFRNPPELVAGLDVGFKGDKAVAACVLLSFPDLRPVETSVAEMAVRFPYVPGFLAFREVPAMLRALRRLSKRPDVVLVDAQGIAHPRRCGEATHLGVVAGLPTVGVAKRRLCGEALFQPAWPDSWAPLYDRGEPVGFVYLSKARCRPIYISPGHMVGFSSALELVRSCLRGHKLPEPTRLAHLATKEALRAQEG